MNSPVFTSPHGAVAALALSTALLAGAVPLARADEHRDHGRDHDRARAALQAGEILSLQQVLARVQPRYPGEVLAVELEREDGRWIYELKLLQTGGRLLRLDVDAKTAEVLRSRARTGPAGRLPASTPGQQP
ncbi:PepSY domain-containing protein [Pelomonas sp. APW6]|uniref:PepSY domain-containing protein n=1 Tax=Roseateles subflavus TaxID=3053353 RepID=A0ABT7LP86_9BURK|nr:PepSY domain-containing protein [Pelomonas sp. APW6]MDL5034688.1 PepSY domain-containing protein [Pelomonas sp. APW6]